MCDLSTSDIQIPTLSFAAKHLEIVGWNKIKIEVWSMIKINIQNKTMKVIGVQEEIFL